MADKPNYITLNHLATVISALLNKIETKPDESDLANVAFTGNYTDLINKPYLGNYVTESALTDYVEDLMEDAYNYFQPALPSSSGNNGKFLTTDNNGNLSWETNVSDDKTWNGVALSKNEFTATNNNLLIPYLPGTTSTAASLMYASYTPTANAIARYNSSRYLVSTTPTASDNSTKVATTAFVKSKVESLGTVLNYKGTKATAAALPSSDNIAGDVWIVTADNSEHVWNGTAWEEFGPTIDLSGYMEKGIDYVTAGQVSGSTLDQNATAEGINVTASGTAAHAEGYETTVTANYGHAEGYKTTSEWEASHAEGRETFALGDSSHTEGQYTIDFSSGHVEGNGGINGSSGGHVEGIQSLVSSVYLTGPTNDGGTTYTVNSYSDIPSYLLSDSSRLSYNSTVLIADPETGEYSSRYDVINCSVSNNNLTSLTFNKTLGSLTNEPIELSIPNTLGNGAHAEGNFTEAYGNGAHAEGNTNIATGNGAHVEGQGNQALNLYTHAEGTNTTANGEASHAEGNSTIANGNYQHTFGEYNIFDDVKYSRYGIPKGRMRGDANGDGIIDEFDLTIVDNYYKNIDRDVDDVAIWCMDVNTNGSIQVTDASILYTYLGGGATPLTSTPTFADYYNNWTYVKVDNLTGYWTYNVTISSGDATNLVNVYANNLINYSLSGTTLTINVSRPPVTDSSILIDVGSGNGSYSEHVEIVGGGKTNTYLSNARTLDWLGNETLAGKLTLGAGPVNNMDATTKQYVDTAIGNAASITMVDHSTNTTTELNNLTINKLSQAQYNAISTPDPNQLYMITDDTIYAEKSYVDNLFANVDALPSQTGNSGKFLTTNGTTASWATVSTTDNKVTTTLATTTKSYLAGTGTSTTSTGGLNFDTGVYLTTTAGQLNATTYKVNENVTLSYNATTHSLDIAVL